MAEQEKVKILLVEPDSSVAGSLSFFLTEHGYLVQAAANQAQVMTAVQSWKPDLLILNILTRTFNPLDLLADLKKDPLTENQKVIIVSQTPRTEAVTGPSPKVSGYLTKPVDFEALKAALARAVGKPSPEKPLTVLVADDDAEFSDLLKMFLEANNYKTLVVSDPFQVTTRMRTEKPDLLLLDIMMPRKDGFTRMDELQDEAAT
ncbi:MAG: hypothetical protein COT18_00070, partial [Elusimicrobia bacterium CG08_land_8_20_14_0_20_59_10]